MNINTLIPIAVVFVVIAFTVSIGSIILDEAAEEFCSGTTISTSSPVVNSSAVNPVTSGYFGCCTTMNSSDSQDCDTWDTTAPVNASNYGLESLEELSTWLPTLALVVIASIIIGILITYLARGSGAV